MLRQLPNKQMKELKPVISANNFLLNSDALSPHFETAQLQVLVEKFVLLFVPIPANIESEK